MKTIGNECVIINIDTTGPGRPATLYVLDGSGYGTVLPGTTLVDAVNEAEGWMDQNSPLCEPGGLRGELTVTFNEEIIFPSGVTMLSPDGDELEGAA